MKNFLVFSVQFNNCILPSIISKDLLLLLIFRSLGKLRCFLPYGNAVKSVKTSSFSISFSLLTCLYTIWYFIQFSRYIMVENKGLEPLTPCVQGRCSPSWANSPRRNCRHAFRVDSVASSFKWRSFLLFPKKLRFSGTPWSRFSSLFWLKSFHSAEI